MSTLLRLVCFPSVLLLIDAENAIRQRLRRRETIRLRKPVRLLTRLLTKPTVALNMSRMASNSLLDFF